MIMCSLTGRDVNETYRYRDERSPVAIMSLYHLCQVTVEHRAFGIRREHLQHRHKRAIIVLK